MKPTELDSMNRLRVQAENKAALYRRALVLACNGDDDQVAFFASEAAAAMDADAAQDDASGASASEPAYYCPECGVMEGNWHMATCSHRGLVKRHDDVETCAGSCCDCGKGCGAHGTPTPAALDAGNTGTDGGEACSAPDCDCEPGVECAARAATRGVQAAVPDQRSRFEAWAARSLGIGNFDRTDNEDSDYLNPDTNDLWCCWQEAVAGMPGRDGGQQDAAGVGGIDAGK